MFNWNNNLSKPTKMFIPKIDFHNARINVLSSQRTDRCYVDFHSESNFGEHLLEVTYPKDNKMINLVHQDFFIEENRIQSVRRSSSTVSLKNLKPVGKIVLDNFNICIRRKLRYKSLLSIDHEITRQELSEILTISTFFYDLNATPEIIYHVVPKSLWNDVNPNEIISILDKCLSSAVVLPYGYNIEQFKQKYSFHTFGQFLFAMLHFRYKKSAYKSTVNLKLLLLVLSVYANSDQDEILATISSIYNWLVLQTCDSCVERLMYFSKFVESRKMYEVDGITTERSTISIKGLNINFKVNHCGSDVKYSLNEVPRLTHSVMHRSSMNEICKIIVLKSDEGIAIQHKIPTCHSLAFRLILDKCVNAIRGALMGNSNVLLHWFIEIESRNDNIFIVTEYMSTLILMYESLPILRNLIKNLFLFLYFVGIPEKFLNNFETFNDRQCFLEGLIQMEAQDYYGLLSFCFNINTALKDVQDLVNSSKRISFIKECMDQIKINMKI